jgi:photosystem II stability/assembly factor-like uncharacterized protein
MSESVRRRRALVGRALALIAFAGLFVGCVLIARPVEAGAAAGGRLVAEPVLSASAAGVRQLFGASPNEAPGEVWGAGEAPHENIHIVRYTSAGGWEAVPDPVDPEGHTVTLPGGGMPLAASAGRTTPAGGVVTVAAPDGESEPQDLIIRDPGGPFRALPAPPEPTMPKGGQLFKPGTPPLVKLAAVEEPTGVTGAFVVPYSTEPVSAVLHYDGTEWKSEPICLLALAECGKKTGIGFGFSVLALETAGPGQEWMLARQPGTAKKARGIILLKREEGMWVNQELEGPLGAIYSKEKPVVSGIAQISILGREKAQPLTVTSEGVWIDANVTAEGQTFTSTLFYDSKEGDPHRGELLGSWCEPPETILEPARKELCGFPLPAELPAVDGRSFAWPGSGAEGDHGNRVITGVGQGAILVYENGAFRREPLSGNGGSSAGAAITYTPGQGTEEGTPEGWLGPSYRLTRAPVPSGLQPWSVPFRQPLLAVAPEPGVAAGALSSKALAVGAAGEVARYLPGIGWQPESLLSGSNNTRATPNLRGVAWPTPSFAYAVGDEGAMWMWRASTGLWEPDPGSPPNLIRGNFTGIAFDPEEPERGYAVGKQGLLLEYGKRWTQDPIPSGLSPEINITSIAFAGHEALATWMLQVPSERNGGAEYIGGLIVNDGSGWRVEEGAGAALAEVEKGVTGYAARRVAALPDGGAVVVGLRGGVIERQGAGDPWSTVPGPLLGYPSAVAAIREGGQLRALISVGRSPTEEGTDRPQAIGQPAEGQPPLLTEPYPLPQSGSLIRQTATGWQDEERQSYPRPPTPTNQNPQAAPLIDLPREPDPILGILVSGEGTEGWVVGGQTGETTASFRFGKYLSEGVQTASVERYGPAAAPPINSTTVPISTPSGQATFAIGGGAACVSACADLVDTGIGPDVWLGGAVGRAASIPGVRGFLYTGGGVSTNLEPNAISPTAFGEEESAYAERLQADAGNLPVFAAPAASDLYRSSLATFGSRFKGFSAPLGEAAGGGIVPISEGERASGNYSYSFDSVNSSGLEGVRVIVLDESVMPLSASKLCWLSSQLAEARVAERPAIVLGNREVGSETELLRVLVTGSSPICTQGAPGAASAYFFETEGNTKSTLSWEGASIPAYGTGSLGYMKVPNTERQEFLPASGFLLGSVDLAARSPATNVAPVTAPLIPSIGTLAIDARDGTLLRRSQVALFEALARRPIGGSKCTQEASSECLTEAPDPYVQIPSRCFGGHGYLGRSCANEIMPEYQFTSSRPDIANFVEVDPNSTSSRAAFLNSAGKTVPDPSSGLLCAYNSGTTVVSVETGGLSYSVPVVVQEGSVARPCGTVPRTDIPAEQQKIGTPPFEAEAEPELESEPETLPPPLQPEEKTPVVFHAHNNPPPNPVPHHAPPKPVPHHLEPPFFFQQSQTNLVQVIVPPPPPPAAEPAPPTGTSPVTQPAVSPEPEEEEEAAFDLVHHAVAYLPGDRQPPALQVTATEAGEHLPRPLLPALILFAAAGLAGIAGPRLRRSPEPAFQGTAPKRRHFDEHP